MLHVKEVCGEVVCGGITGVDQQDAIVEAVKALSSQLDNLVSEQGDLLGICHLLSIQQV